VLFDAPPEHRAQPAARHRRGSPQPAGVSNKGDPHRLLAPPRRPPRRLVAVRPRPWVRVRATPRPRWLLGPGQRPGPGPCPDVTFETHHTLARRRGADRPGLARHQPHPRQHLHPLPRSRHADAGRRHPARLGAVRQLQPERGTFPAPSPPRPLPWPTRGSTSSAAHMGRPRHPRMNVVLYQQYVADLIDNIKKAPGDGRPDPRSSPGTATTAGPRSRRTRAAQVAYAGRAGYQEVHRRPGRPPTSTRTAPRSHILESIRLDLGVGSQVHPVTGAGNSRAVSIRFLKTAGGHEHESSSLEDDHRLGRGRKPGSSYRRRAVASYRRRRRRRLRLPSRSTKVSACLSASGLSNLPLTNRHLTPGVRSATSQSSCRRTAMAKVIPWTPQGFQDLFAADGCVQRHRRVW